ncbi:hypothetical protein [Spirosoma panaciterrae]|uniref:hypothetical protein n=1 Tax=Spirosoma panaciterrae TaxID=496058 RepID=UPI000376CD23|nr:hypothetical protein [Spirosoma panaciterrae]
MRNIFEERLLRTAKQIVGSHDRDLFAENIESRMYESNKIDTPYLDKGRTTVSIQEEVISFHNAPPGISFTPGQTMEVAYFQVPIVGDLELFAALVANQFYNRQVKYVDGRTLYYREYSTKLITGNTEVIDSIKQRAKREIDNIQAALDEFKKTADEFNEGDLKQTISNYVSKERERRSKKSNSENQLNPFG